MIKILKEILIEKLKNEFKLDYLQAMAVPRDSLCVREMEEETLELANKLTVIRGVRHLELTEEEARVLIIQERLLKTLHRDWIAFEVDEEEGLCVNLFTLLYISLERIMEEHEEGL